MAHPGGCPSDVGESGGGRQAWSGRLAGVTGPQHAVLITIGPPADPSEFGLDLVEDPIIEVLEADPDLGEYDGHVIGAEGAVIYLYGADADRLLAGIEPALRTTPLPAGSWALKRYGGPGAREETVPLT